MDEILYPSARRRSVHHQPTGPTLFDDAAPDPIGVAPVIRTPAPSAPGSDSSAMAAAAISGPFRSMSHRKIMVVLASLPLGASLPRHKLEARTGLRESSLCGRLKELRGEDDAFPWMVEKVDGAHDSPRGSTKVDGYRLTAAGRARVARAGG